MYTTLTRLGLLAIAAAILMTRQATAQNDQEEEELIIKIYRVSDLVVVTPNYPYEGTFLPGTTRTPPGSASSGTVGGQAAAAGAGAMGGGMGGMGGGMMGGMGGGGMGGGMFRVADDHLAQVGGNAPQQGGGGGAMPGGIGGMGGGGVVRQPFAARAAFSPPRLTIATLMNAITSIVEPGSWDDDGGVGTIQPVGSALAVRNATAVHAKLEKFLADLRRESDTLRTISVDAHWLLLNDEQLANLRGAGQKKSSAAGQEITREALAALPNSTLRAHGQITCLNGQTVHLVSGLVETKIQGGIPVVGGPSNVGYQANITSPHLGALLQITTSLLAGDVAALVDLQSVATQWQDAQDPTKLISVNDAGNPVVQVDRLKVGAQQLATSLRVPLGKPTLVGGMTVVAQKEQGTDAVHRLYLVIEIAAPAEK